MKLLHVVGALLMAQALPINGYCPEAALAPLPFVLEYAVWRGWHQAVVYTPDLEPGCRWAIVRLMKCLSVNGVATASESLQNVRLRANLGIIILSPRLRRNGTANFTKFVKKLHDQKMDTSSYDWLLTARSNKDFGFINEILNATSVRFDQNIVVAYTQSNWDRVQSMSGVEVPYPVESRNFLGEELVVGRCNSTGDGGPSLDDDGPSAEPMLDDILHFLTVRLNTTSSIRYYSKLGFRTYEGTWTGLLGALTDYTVDVALEPVTVHAARLQDMDFIFPIAETMCNIYIRQQETSTVRDIFLAPFSVRLVACVVAVVLIAAIAIIIISRASSTMCDHQRRMGYTEALIWSTGILCQQGGTWTPTNPSGSVLLIVCLLFAVVTYNAYAAFITSVLSVRVASVDTIAAVLHSPNFKIGYIRNGADQMYLMSTKDVQLNAFYIRGYSDADNLVSSAEEGLARAARQDYAFFAGQRVARSTLRSLSQARGRCAVRELPVHSTRAHLAFPLPRQSPYARPTLLSGGALARLEAALVPDMPQCAPPPGFASARATDVRSALILLIVGLITSLLLVLLA
ncbi:hypothetical protein PYW07_002325 [Mythimna separata]|uniref:Ionotropic glutamate receptor C-terminal domain-containing protein n=1 Tax=Mythimna separata TaxID=271217 RepID=A0AAD7YPD3_MYTSE|nr:hypothetical protein PYW07_002325 [Mythimna separata]